MSTVSRRTFLRGSIIAASSTLALTKRGLAAPSERIRAAVIGLGIRGRELAKETSTLKGVQTTWLVDPDLERAEAAKEFAPSAKTARDLRFVLDDKDVDVVILATCNHWHCLAAIWACQAGKDVYVEKPLGHNIAEQRRLLEFVDSTNRIVQVGTQQRSDHIQEELRHFLHEEKALGDIQHVHANFYGIRQPVKKLPHPLRIPKQVDYDLWCGPAEKRELYRDRLHYDWHWDWNTGNGEMGNLGTHILDDVRNVVFQDQLDLPKRILTGGGRFVWDDAGETPNVQFAYYDTGSIPVLFDLTNLPIKPGSKAAPAYKNIRFGYTVHAEGGRYSGGRGGGAAYDKNGERIRKFSGSGGAGHIQNFIDAVRSRKRSMLNADVVQGHYSSAWCTFTSIACLNGSAYSRDDALAINSSMPAWRTLLDQAGERLEAHGLSLKHPKLALSPLMEIDSKAECFTGTMSEHANRYLAREYRSGFELPSV